MNSIGFNIGLGFFVVNLTGYNYLIYPISTIAVLLSGLPTVLGKNIILDELKSNKLRNLMSKFNSLNDVKINKYFNDKINKYTKWIMLFKNVLDDRARSVDLILLIMIIDINFNFNFSLYIFLILYMKNLFRFILLFYNGVKSNWPEKILIDIKKANYGKK